MTTPSIQTQFGISFAPSKSTYTGENNAKVWTYTTAQWKELFDDVTAAAGRDKTKIYKAYDASYPTIQKYSGNAPVSRKTTKHTKIKLKPELTAKPAPVAPTTPQRSDNQPTLRKPYKPLTTNKNRVLGRIENEIETKREELAQLEAALAALNTLDIDMIKALLAS